jgi:predicted AlkP superfamily pyrophosphatase or phosphodiesterase
LTTATAFARRTAGDRLAPLKSRALRGGRLAARALLFAALVAFGRSAAAASAEFVINISVDGLNAGLLRSLIDGDEGGDFENFRRLVDEGAHTFNARADATYNLTIPNHATMMTGRPTGQPSGQGNTVYHGYTGNRTSRSGVTLHNSGNPHLSYVASAFDVAHDNGLSTALYASKSKFVLFERSYDAENGAADAVSPDDGTDKIDVYVNEVPFFSRNASKINAAFVSRMTVSPLNYSWVHYCDPDVAGHNDGWGSEEWVGAVRNVDGYLGEIFDLIASESALSGKTAIILTADHGGTGITHGDPAVPANYIVPYFVWGPGVEAAADLYALNPETRLDPGTGLPDYDAAVQPIRNGDAANLGLQLLGLGPVPGSTINANQDLAVSSPKGE